MNLAGRRILLTRRAEQSGSLRARLESLGADIVEVASIEVVLPKDTRPLDAALTRLHRYHWILFTSANTVRFVGERLAALGRAGTLTERGVRVGSVGPATTRLISETFGVDVAAEPAADFSAEGLLAALGSVEDQTILLPQSDRARDALKRTLEARGARVEAVVCYETFTPPGLAEAVAAALRPLPDLVVFASPSAVDGFVGAAGSAAAAVASVVMGPVTERAARAAGLHVVGVASPSNEAGLVAAILAAASGLPGADQP